METPYTKKIRVRDLLGLCTGCNIAFCTDITLWEDTTFLILISDQDCSYSIKTLDYSFLNLPITDIMPAVIHDNPRLVVEVDLNYNCYTCSDCIYNRHGRCTFSEEGFDIDNDTLLKGCEFWKDKWNTDLSLLVMNMLP